MIPDQQAFDGSLDGQPLGLFVLKAGDIHCAVTNYGARLLSLMVPDKNGTPTDIVLGYPSLEAYLDGPEDYMGAIVGRCANRIAGGHFTLNNRDYYLPKNNGDNTLHGGLRGLHARAWEVKKAAPDSLTLYYSSPDGEEGFPGRLDIEVTYRLEATQLTISYRAVPDAATPVNLSNHTYWNLSGEGSATIEDHQLMIAALHYTPVDASLIPTGEIAPVGGTPFYFREGHAISAGIGDAHDQLLYGKGYDHNWVLDSKRADGPAVQVSSPLTGITLQVFTDQSGLQFYSGNYLDGTRRGKSGRLYGFRSALVLEPQGFPDAVHHSSFPSVILQPGSEYRSQSRYVFV